MSNISFLPDFKLLPIGALLSPLSDSVTVQHTSSWMYCGPLLQLSDAKLPGSYHEWHDATLNGALTASLLSFLSFANKFLSDVGIHHYWLTIRATKPTPDYDKPRWHTDEDFFNQGAKEIRTQWKLATTLLGPGTLFIEDGRKARKTQKKVKLEVREETKGHVCTLFSCPSCASTSLKVRERHSEELKNHKVVQAAVGECCFFRIGENRGAVHSEPPQDCDRVFVNLVPGTDVELRNIMEKWGMEFPRSWSTGMPLCRGRK